MPIHDIRPQIIKTRHHATHKAFIVIYPIKLPTIHNSTMKHLTSSLIE